MSIATTRFILVGGFGAGKTTLLGQAAARLAARGHRVALLANDQAADLVDTAWLQESGAAVDEVSGGCRSCLRGCSSPPADGPWPRAAGVADDWKSYYYFISDMIRWAAQLAAEAGKRLWIVTDGFYVKRPVLKVARVLGVVVIGRLRKDAALWTLPPTLKKGQCRGRGRPRKYGDKRISLAKRAGQPRGWRWGTCVQYGEHVRKKVKTFLATYRPAYGRSAW